MPFHAHVHQYRAGTRGQGDAFLFVNLDEDTLISRIVNPWDMGSPITYDGETADSRRSKISIFETADSIQPIIKGTERLKAMQAGRDATNDWITGFAGSGSAEVGHQQMLIAAKEAAKDPKRVMVVHGRNLRARDAMFTFLRALSLAPIEWEEAVAATGMGSPHNLAAARAAMEVAQAVVVIMTAEDRAGLLPDLADDPASADVALQGQPRQNVTLEAGLAMGIDEARTILVQLGPIRGMSDFAGLNEVRMTNVPGTRGGLRSRLASAGCAVANSGTDWMSSEAGGDFESCVVTWKPDPASA